MWKLKRNDDDIDKRNDKRKRKRNQLARRLTRGHDPYGGGQIWDGALW
jgi:hypothetical protein